MSHRKTYKIKREEIAQLSADIYSLKKVGNLEVVSHLCAVISILSNGTKHEWECTEIIKTVCPEFFIEPLTAIELNIAQHKTT